MDSLRQAVSPSQYAKAIGVNVDKVVRWIRSGELFAINVSQSPAARKPRWRIPLDAIERFEAARATSSTPPPRRRTAKPAKQFV